MDDYNLDDFFNRIEERKYKRDPIETNMTVKPEVEHLLIELSEYQPEN